jgi:outer membrane protein
MQKPLIAVLLASTFALQAQAADLIQVYQQALANDATYASARASLTAGQESITQGRAGLLPTIGITGAYQRNSSSQASWNSGTLIDPNNPSQVIPSYSGTANTGQYTISLQQPLFRWDRWETYQQSKLQQSIAEAQFAQAQQDLITRVAQAYFDVLSAQDTLDSTRAQKEATTEQLASAKRNFEVGTQTITDTHEAQAAYDLVVSQEIAAVNDLENKKTALQAIIGAPPAALATLRTGVTLAAPQPPRTRIIRSRWPS